jgi:hypothetical protein
VIRIVLGGTRIETGTVMILTQGYVLKHKQILRCNQFMR